MSARRGATVLELVVALVITGAMAAAGTSAFSSIVAERDVIRSSTIEMEKASALREMIRTWITSGTIQIQQGGGPRGRGGATAIQAAPTSATNSSGMTAVSAAAASGDEVTFVTTAPTPAMAPNVRIRLFIDADDNTPETGLCIEYQPTDPGTQIPLQRRQLSAEIGTLTVEYLDSRTTRWYSASQAATITPVAVRITMAAADKAVIADILQVPLTFPVGNGR